MIAGQRQLRLPVHDVLLDMFLPPTYVLVYFFLDRVCGNSQHRY
jgi:hypothetical protein